MATVQQLQDIINNPALDQNTRDLAAKRLQEMSSQQTVSVPQAGSVDPQVMALISALENALRGGSGSANINDIRKAINEEFSKRKITESDLSPSLMARLQSSRPVTLTVRQNFNIVSTKAADSAFLSRPLTQLLLSDLEARNNVYLYGGAGTGKTFIAEKIAELLGWKKVVLNCNQFTSPLDILGGQTITGYQEGKLSMAWSNEIINEAGQKEEVKGVVLILDELPKIDPNTAGILNEALAKVKDFKQDDKTGQRTIAPTIMNGKNRELSLKNLFVIATGNVPLNTIDPDYEANFKQDLSLQDRFIGSTYKVYVDAEYEFRDIMKGFAFIWIFLFKVREEIEKLKATGQAFVSLRLMINAKATYVAYRDILYNNKKIKGMATGVVENPKTLKETMDTFFNLFKPATKSALLQAVDYDAFLRIVKSKDKMPYDPNGVVNFDTQEEIDLGNRMVAQYNQNMKP